jgi:hypothetical protein
MTIHVNRKLYFPCPRIYARGRELRCKKRKDRLAGGVIKMRARPWRCSPQVNTYAAGGKPSAANTRMAA